MACGSPSRSLMTVARSMGTSDSPTGGPSRGSVWPRCEPRRSSETQANRSFAAREAAVGAFNDRSRDVWAWAAAAVPASFHPRHALQRWYRYHILDDLPLPALRRAGSLFVGEHDFRSFTSDPLKTALTIDEISVTRSAPVILFDIRARTFRRSMVRRIVAATIRHANGESSEAELQAALGGSRRDFGIVRPEPLFLMDVRYPFSMDVILKHRVRDAWLSIGRDAELRVRLIQAWHRAALGES